MHLTLHLTTACNMRCSYCYAPPHDGAPMSDEIGRQALDLAARLTSDSCGVVFFGGEPLLCKDRIASLVAYARHLEQNRAGRFHFKITTNGLLLDAAFLEFAVRNDILIAMSLDGVREAHDQHRRLAGGGPTFDVLVERLQMLLSVRPYSSVLMAVNPDTARHLADSVTFLLELGCRYLIVSLNYAADWQEADFRVLGKQFKRLGKLYVRWTRAGRKFYLSPFEVKLSSHINQHCWRKERCELAERQLSVDPQGYLFPCVQFPRAGPKSRWCIGHVSRGIDEDARRRIHDESEAEKAFCRECALKERCHNTCGCLNWQTTGTINGISPVLCRYEQMLTPIADRVGNVLYRKRDPLFLHKHYNAAYPVLSLLEDTLLKKQGPGMKSDRLRHACEWLIAAGLLLGGLAILVLGAVSYWRGMPADTIWITGDERAPQLRAALVSGILHIVYSAPQMKVPSESRQELAGFYFRQVTCGGTGAFGIGLPFWFLSGGVLSAAVIAYCRGPRRRARRRRRGECIHCGYPLAGLTEPRCPECGRRFKPAVA